MGIPESWNQELSPYKASKLIAEKFGILEQILQNTTDACEKKCTEIDNSISAVANKREESEREFSEWNAECESFINDVENSLNNLSVADAAYEQEQENVSEEEKDLLAEFSKWEIEHPSSAQSPEGKNER